MIYAVTTLSHRYTFEALKKAGAPLTSVSYPRLLARRRLPFGTYIFTDFDRLSFWQLELAGRLAHQLSAAGCCVLNDPAVVLQRLALLRRLYRQDINQFKAWPAEDLEDVDRFPVFLRTQSAHRGVLTELLPDAAALRTAMTQANADGYSMRDLMIVEYCAEPVKEDLFRKLSILRVGDRYVTVPNVHERTWTAKFGEIGSADQALYEDDHRIVSENTYVASLKAAFELAQVDFGRVDFGLVGGKPQIYEINTNPHIDRVQSHPFPIRLKSADLSFAAILSAVRAIDRGGRRQCVQVDPGELMNSKSRRVRVFPGYQWMP